DTLVNRPLLGSRSHQPSSGPSPSRTLLIPPGHYYATVRCRAELETIAERSPSPRGTLGIVPLPTAEAAFEVQGNKAYTVTLAAPDEDRIATLQKEFAERALKGLPLREIRDWLRELLARHSVRPHVEISK